MSRLASFSGPSTPSSAPVASQVGIAAATTTTTTPIKKSSSKKTTKSSTPNRRTESRSSFSPNASSGGGNGNGVPEELLVTPSKSSNGRTVTEAVSSEFVETVMHRKLRQTLLEIRSVARKWNELVKGDGFRAAKELIDTRTTIKNALALIPEGQVPRKPIVTPNMLIINEKILFLEKMVLKLLQILKTMIAEMRNPTIDWERARVVLTAWKDGTSPYHRRPFSSSSSWDTLQIGGLLLEGGWSEQLDEICAVEIPNWK
ncbi:hypothetical protein FRC17_005914 [Serendipita sp. 399]|nr:hypothetical protein FRC17_005914 [Serendipita sp. 399]